MPLFMKMDFRADGRLGIWYSRDEYGKAPATSISETRIRAALIALADVLDPEDPNDPEKEDGNE